MSTIATHTHLATSRPHVAGPLVVRWDRVIGLLVALLVVGWLLGGWVGPSEADEPAADPITVVVQPGDTLWDLSRVHAPAGVATLEYASLVEERNGVRAGVLLPGSVLVLPQD